MKIQTLDQDISALFQSGFFRIPRFQRPYSWQISEVEDFWKDTIEESESDYFIGAIVLYTWEKGINGVVDGQQRLATIAMTLCAVRNALRKEGQPGLADGVQGLIERKDINNNLQFVLQTETAYPYFQEQILKGEPSQEKLNPISSEEQRLQKAFEYLSTRIQATVDSVQRDTTIAAVKKQESIKQKLVTIRDRILALKVIVTILESEDDAYTIFETINTRGMDLTIGDLVRTLLTRLIPNPNKGLDRPKDRFNNIVKIFETSEADISTSTFLHHYWLSRHEYTTEKKLYKAIKKTVRTQSNAQEFLTSIESDANCYRYIHEPAYRSKWRIEECDLRDSLNALNLFRVRQQVPFVLAVMRDYEREVLNLKLAKRALRAVENFHFVFTAITSQRSSGGISFMYALHARELQKADTSALRKEAVNGLITKLKQKLPPYDEFVAYFRMLICSEKYTKRKELVRYILRRFTEWKSTGVAPSWDKMTIEHIADQSKSRYQNLPDEMIAEIGNLVFVSDTLNAKLKTKAFSEKVKLLAKSNLSDEYLDAQSDWGAKQIRERSDFMAEQAFKKIWKV